MQYPALTAAVIFVAGLALAGAAAAQSPMSPALAPPRSPVARKQPSNAAAPTRQASGAAKNSGITQDDLNKLDQVLQTLNSKERKQFTKALKNLSPEGRKQLVEGITRQQQSKGPSSHLKSPQVVKKSPPPLPRRLVF